MSDVCFIIVSGMSECVDMRACGRARVCLNVQIYNSYSIVTIFLPRTTVKISAFAPASS